MMETDIFSKLEAVQRKKLGAITAVWQQVSKDAYMNKVTGKIVSRTQFERLQDNSAPGTVIIQLLR